MHSEQRCCFREYTQVLLVVAPNTLCGAKLESDSVGDKVWLFMFGNSHCHIAHTHIVLTIS